MIVLTGKPVLDKKSSALGAAVSFFFRYLQKPLEGDKQNDRRRMR